jgi:hypothetical protein
VDHPPSPAGTPINPGEAPTDKKCPPKVDLKDARDVHPNPMGARPNAVAHAVRPPDSMGPN